MKASFPHFLGEVEHIFYTDDTERLLDSHAPNRLIFKIKYFFTLVKGITYFARVLSQIILLFLGLILSPKSVAHGFSLFAVGVDTMAE